MRDRAFWGWKDPRTTLFLDFWENLLPTANYLLIYRAPWEVVDSLYRRGAPLFVEQPELAVKIWMHCNQKLLDFSAQFPDRCFLVSVYSIAKKIEQFITAITAKFRLNLNPPPTDIYDSSLFDTQVSNGHRPTLVAYYYPQALDIYQELNKREIPLSDAPDLSWLEQLKVLPDKAWAFSDWMHIRNLEQQVKSLKFELD